MAKVKETRTVTIALSLLDWFSDQRQEIGLTEFVELSGLPKANVLRHLTALENSGILKKDAHTKKYHLGYKTLELAYLAKKQIKLRDMIMPYMKKLGELTGETICLQVRDDRWGICVERLDPNNTLVYLPPIGSREHLHTGASRKVLLAHLPDDQIEAIIKDGLPATATNTVTDPQKLRREIQAIRKQGYAISNSEHVDGVTALSGPIKKDDGTVVASISIVGPTFRIKEQEIKLYLQYLLDAAAEVSKQLGYKVENLLQQKNNQYKMGGDSLDD